MGTPKIRKAKCAVNTVYAAAFRHAPEAQVIFRAGDLTVLDVNAVFARTVGCRRARMVGIPLSKLNFWPDSRLWESLRVDLNAGKQNLLCETSLQHRNGTVTPVQMTLLALTSGRKTWLATFRTSAESSSPAAEYAVMIDKLQQSEQKYHMLFQNMTTGFALHEIIDDAAGQPVDYRFLEVNPAFERLTGLSSAEAVGKRFFEVFPQVDAAWIKTFERVALTGEPLAFQSHVREFDRHYDTWVFRPDEGRLAMVLSDITERKQAEEEITHLKNYLTNIIDSMPSVLVGMDPEGLVTEWNRQAEQVSGIPAAMAIGRPVGSVLPDFSAWIESMRDEIVNRRPVSREKLMVAHEHPRFYDMMIYPLTANGIQGAVLRIEDVTERTRIHELMIQNEKMISVGGLAAGMAHEINNPLGIITQAAQNLERRILPSLPANQAAAAELGLSMEAINAYFAKREILLFIQDIRTASTRAAKIISNMLLFSRKSQSIRQDASLAEILNRSVDLAGSDYDMKKRFDFRNIAIVRDYASDLPLVPVIVVEIEQVFLNLLKNAAQALAAHPPERKPQIVLRLRQENGYAVAEITDNGPGMEDKVLHRIFEPFFTTKEPGIGTGLGLSVSYMIITQNHKGLLEAESIPGTGACFTVRLPLAAPLGYP